MSAAAQRRLASLADDLRLAPLPTMWTGLDAVLPLIEYARTRGATFLLKIDGERGPLDNGAYTVIISGGELGDRYIRRELPSLEQAVAEAMADYLEAVRDGLPRE